MCSFLLLTSFNAFMASDFILYPSEAPEKKIEKVLLLSEGIK